MKNSRIDIRICSKQKQIYQQHAKSKGLSLSALFEELINEDIKNSLNAFLLEDTPKNNHRKLEQYTKE